MHLIGCPECNFKDDKVVLLKPCYDKDAFFCEECGFEVTRLELYDRGYR